MGVSRPEPETVREAILDSPVHEALETLDTVFHRRDETVTLEIAETTYADLSQGVSSLHRMDCYVEHDLEHFKRNLPGTFFSQLPDDYDSYDLMQGDATLHLKFAEAHEDADPIDLPYQALTVAIPTTDAYFSKFHDAVQTRMEQDDGDGTDDPSTLDDLFG